MTLWKWRHCSLARTNLMSYVFHRYYHVHADWEKSLGCYMINNIDQRDHDINSNYVNVNNYQTST